MNNKILEIIRELIEACGPQSFSEIFHEVRTQCDVSGLKETHCQVKAHLVYLVSLRTLVECNDDFGVVYGCPGDF
jgi:hypothetical protein